MSNQVRAATHRALAAREALLQEYPHWEEWRTQARAIKAEALTRLDELLASLTDQVQQWGGTVLFARDAPQARNLILEIARRHGVTSVVKSKSMTTEEIGLNPFLAGAGIRSLETDLGEFIVQLAGHPPAHLTAPALHLGRHQIAALFQEHLRESSTAEPEALTRQAAEYLRPRYFEAQMGITGVNFAGGDGTLVLLENEGNLRLTATLPGVHVALMGLEKVIPGLEEVEVFLRLLPASATGQRATALVHFLRGLKPHPQGEQAFYLIILDNGRRRLAGEPVLKEALYCLRCGACLNICPVFQAGGAHLYGRVYPGAIGILLAPYLAPVGDICDLCTQCGACQEICPVKIHLAENIIQIRRLSPKFRGLRTLSRLAGLGLRVPPLYRRLEPGLRLLPELIPSLKEQGATLAPESFHRRQRRAGGRVRQPRAPVPSCAPRPPSIIQGLEGKKEGRVESKPPGPSRKMESRLKEVGGSRLRRVKGPGALARLLLAAGEPLLLEDHPWLRQVAPELRKRGGTPLFAGSTRVPQARTAVSVALGAIPELGAVVVPCRTVASSLLPFRGRHLVLVPLNRARLSLSEALKLVRQEGGLVSWLTGPTRTADIEKILVLGAQGPGELEVVLYRPEE
jgi:L-lactate dehydrogenase complex protein LldF